MISSWNAERPRGVRTRLRTLPPRQVKPWKPHCFETCQCRCSRGRNLQPKWQAQNTTGISLVRWPLAALQGHPEPTLLTDYCSFALRFWRVRPSTKIPVRKAKGNWLWGSNTSSSIVSLSRNKPQLSRTYKCCHSDKFPLKMGIGNRKLIQYWFRWPFSHFHWTLKYVSPLIRIGFPPPLWRIENRLSRKQGREIGTLHLQVVCRERSEVVFNQSETMESNA